MSLPAWPADVDWTGALTIAGAALGAVLGVINTWWALFRDRVRLQVIPLWHGGDRQMQNGQIARLTSAFAGSLEHHPDGRIGVRVINRSFFEITIESVGFTPSGYADRHLRKARLVRRFIGGDADDLVRLPCRLAPRESITIWCAFVGDQLDANIHDARRVYVTTACGLDVFATSGLFRRLTAQAAGFRQHLE